MVKFLEPTALHLREITKFREPTSLRTRPNYDRPIRPNYRMSEKAPVTIAAGFCFDKGLLLCADTQYSADQKTYESKVFHIQHYGAHVLMLLVGSEGYAKRAVEMVAAEVKNIPADGLTKENLHNAIEFGMRKMLERHVYNRPDLGRETCPDFQFVIGLYSPADGIFLMKTEGETAFVVDGKACLGTGSYLGDYLSRMYLGPQQSLNNAVALATYLLHEVKAHDTHCGGQSELRVLWNDGRVSPVEIQDIALVEEYAPAFNKALAMIFYALADPDKSDDEMHQETLKADEELFLSLVSRRDRKGYAKLAEMLQRWISDMPDEPGQ